MEELQRSSSLLKRSSRSSAALTIDEGEATADNGPMRMEIDASLLPSIQGAQDQDQDRERAQKQKEEELRFRGASPEIAKKLAGVSAASDVDPCSSLSSPLRFVFFA